MRCGDFGIDKMPYVIRHIINQTFVGKQRILVDMPDARVFPTERGAKRAMLNYCRYPVSGLINQSKFSCFEVVPVKIEIE